MSHNITVRLKDAIIGHQTGSKLTVTDENGKIIHEGEFKSFTSNFLKLFFGGGIRGSESVKAYNLNGTAVSIDELPNSAIKYTGGLHNNLYGISVGNRNTAVGTNDYNLGWISGLTYEITTQSEPVISGNTISYTISREISNTSGADITISEVGLVCGESYDISSDNLNNCLIARDLLSLTLQNGQKSTFCYTISVTANSEGGFVKNFLDILRSILSLNGNTVVCDSTGMPSGNQYGILYIGNNKIIVIANNGNVYKSSDLGETWSQVGTFPRSNLFSPIMWFYNNTVYVTGYGSCGQAYSGICSSADEGSTWTNTSKTMPASVTGQTGFFEFNGYKWVLSQDRKVFASSDCLTWTTKTSTAPWESGLYGCVAGAFKGKMYLAGGHVNYSPRYDIYESADGNTWTKIGQLPFSIISEGGNQMICTDAKLYIIAQGVNAKIYSSYDAVNWVETGNTEIATNNTDVRPILANEKVLTLSNIADKFYQIKFANRPLQIKVGSSSSSWIATDTSLGAEIANGSDMGELSYGDRIDVATTDPSVSGSKTLFNFARTFTNLSGDDVTINEVGLFYGEDMLIARIIPQTPIVVSNGETTTIELTFETEV